MSHTFSLVDSLALSDLQTFLGRAGRVEDGSVRLIAGSGLLAVYVAIFYPVGLHDETPTVLGLRTFALSDQSAFDVVVPVRSLLDRLARVRVEVEDPSAPANVSVPLEVNTVVWAAISPPRGGWHGLDPMPSDRLVEVADAGIAEIRDAVPAGTGEQLVHRARAEVWSRPIEGFEHIPAGAAFAAHTLGFLAPPEPVRVFETGPWTRLSADRGHVLVRRRAWTLQA
ncbi:MAG: hypothetical protein KF801_09085 [Cryobacterium sp.]|nr:hypothetical protein [Cryobacterium sp.]